MISALSCPNRILLEYPLRNTPDTAQVNESFIVKTRFRDLLDTKKLIAAVHTGVSCSDCILGDLKPVKRRQEGPAIRVSSSGSFLHLDEPHLSLHNPCPPRRSLRLWEEPKIIEQAFSRCLTRFGGCPITNLTGVHTGPVIGIPKRPIGHSMGNSDTSLFVVIVRVETFG